MIALPISPLVCSVLTTFTLIVTFYHRSPSVRDSGMIVGSGIVGFGGKSYVR
jgi:hypothetical protein